MVDGTKFPGPGHAETVWAQLQQFGTALTKRWQKEAALAYCDLKPIVSNITQKTGADGRFKWSYLDKAPVKYHAADCEFRTWASSTDLNEAPPTCKGMVPSGTGAVFTDTDGVDKTMPTRITCPVPEILKQVPNWATAECAVIWKLIPYFDAQNQGTIGAAYAALKEIQEATHLGGSSAGSAGGAGDLPNTVRSLGAGNGSDKDWWVEWTGLAADALREGFLSSPEPTLENHYLMATNLARLVNNRAAIIEHGRNNTVCLLQTATKALGEVTTSTKEVDAHWKALTGVAMALGLVSGGFTAAAAGTFELVAFLAETVIGPAKVPIKKFSTDFRAVVGDLALRFAALALELAAEETAYGDKAAQLRSAVNGIGSFDLELYDFGQNTSTAPTKEAKAKAKDPGGFDANPTDILNLARKCAFAGQDYEKLVSKFDAVLAADGHLTDRNGKALDADKDVIALCRELQEYMTTAGARYFNARDQIAEAGRSYEAADGEVGDAFNRTWDNWRQRDKEASYRPKEFDADEAADATERPAGADADPYREGTDPDGDPRGVYATENPSVGAEH